MSAGPVVIIGAGLAGLCCAKELVSRGLDVLVLEAQDCVGGRLRTDHVAGFQLDRGFQVLQTAYPEAQRQLKYESLKLHAFTPGALIQTQGRTLPMIDPWRRPAYLWPTVLNGIGTLGDRLKLAWLRWQVCRQSPERIWQTTDLSTNDYLLHECGFSQDFVERFLRPWFSGVFLERPLATSSCYFKYLFRMFSQGDVALPELGIGAIAEQLAGYCPSGSIRLKTRVDSVDGQRIQLANGQSLVARHVVLAVDGAAASRLSKGRIHSVSWKATTCLYYAASEAPYRQPILVLNADHQGPINSLCVPSNVAPTYAPPGQALISVSVLGAGVGDQTALENSVRQQLRTWYGHAVNDWKLLAVYPIPQALPEALPGFQAQRPQTQRLDDGTYYCGDYCQSGSIQGALLSGRLCAEAVLAHC